MTIFFSWSNVCIEIPKETGPSRLSCKPGRIFLEIPYSASNTEVSLRYMVAGQDAFQKLPGLAPYTLRSTLDAGWV